MNSKRYNVCMDVPSEVESTKDYLESNLTCNVFSSKLIVFNKEPNDLGKKISRDRLFNKGEFKRYYVRMALPEVEEFDIATYIEENVYCNVVSCFELKP